MSQEGHPPTEDQSKRPGLYVAFAMITGMILGVVLAPESRAADTFPSQDACHTTWATCYKYRP